MGEVQFYLTSLNCDTRNLGQVIRLHWGVENRLHWTLDVTFSEDACGVRTGHAPQNLALLRRIALNAALHKCGMISLNFQRFLNGFKR
ncbi:Transposase, IS4 [Richelia intracellularis]|nr:Transposase, IS4 [Richelia intracellularis]